MNNMNDSRFSALVRAAMRKRAAAVLTPEAEQAAVQGSMAPQGAMPPQGMPMDPSMMGGAPMDPSMAGGMPQQGAPMDPSMGAAPQQSPLPPEILQDQQFIQWLAQQGVQFDPTSGQFFDPSGQPLPAEVIMQAYQAYAQEMQQMMQQGAPADPNMAAGGMPVDPSMMDGAPGGQLPPEIMQDQQFMMMLQQMAGIQMDPNSGMFMTPDGQPVPPEAIMQAYQAYMQQMQGGDPNAMMGGEGDPSMMQGGDPTMMGGMDPSMGGEAQIPAEIMKQIQSAVDASIQGFTAQLDKKIETLLDKLETVKQALESLRDTDDTRDANDKQRTQALQQELAEELNPTTKMASAPSPAPQAQQLDPASVFAALMSGTK